MLTQELLERILGDEAIRTWISKRAYELHQFRGGEHGKAADDWLAAESELLDLASLFEEVFRSKAEGQQTSTQGDVKKTPRASRTRRTRSANAPSSEAPSGTNGVTEDGQASPKQASTKKKKPVSSKGGRGTVG